MTRKMNRGGITAAPFKPVYAVPPTNTVLGGVFDPQLWANESLAILEENMVAASLVHRK